MSSGKFMSIIQKDRYWSDSKTKSIPVPSGNSSRPDRPCWRSSGVMASSTGQVIAPMVTRGWSGCGVGEGVVSTGATGAGAAVGNSVGGGSSVAGGTGVETGRVGATVGGTAVGGSVGRGRGIGVGNGVGVGCSVGATWGKGMGSARPASLQAVARNSKNKVSVIIQERISGREKRISNVLSVSCLLSERVCAGVEGSGWHESAG